MNITSEEKLKTYSTTSINQSTTSNVKNEDSDLFAQELSKLSEEDKKTENAPDVISSDEEVLEEKVPEDLQVSKTEEIKNIEIPKLDEKAEKISSNQTNLQNINQISEKEEKENNKTHSVNTKTEMSQKDKTEEEKLISDVMGGLQGAVAEIKDKLERKDENKNPFLNIDNKVDKKTEKEDIVQMNNDMNITPEKNDAITFQMNANMNFNSNDQSFSELLNNDNTPKLKATAKDIAEEKAILSSMDENIAIANRNKAMIKDINGETENTKIKTVVDNDGIKKVDAKTRVTVETVVKFDNIVMDKNDVDFFVNLVQNGEAELPQGAEKSLQVSKALADLIAKAAKDNQPVRIDFDNNISVIIKIGKDGKISADFLPSSQVAEAYLKENLPLLRQRFDDNNIDYNELNQRKQKQDDKENRKKGRKDE